MRWPLMAAVVGGVVLGAIAYQARAPRVRFDRATPWATSGVWLRADTHTHTSFSDGDPTVDQMADRAVANGCDVLAITDHTDGNLRAATPEYHAAISAARRRLPKLVLITGFEWNVPPGKGQDHAVVLLPPEMDDAAATAAFKTRFDDENKEGENPELAVAGFEWLRSKGAGASVMPVMFLDHPSRKAPSLDAVRTEVEWLSKIGQGIFAGMEGAPGHQNGNPLGAYGSVLHPDDRWDPAIAPNGAIWDHLLAGGSPLSGALATSDFHGEANGDYWPCQFSSTWIYAPDRTVTGVLRALHAGAFFGVHGDIARSVQLLVSADGLPRAAIPGERVRVPSGRTLTVDVRAEVPATDWRGQPNRLDVVEILGITSSGTSVLASGPLEGGMLKRDVVVPAGGMAIRARGRRVIEDGPDLLFYTNAVQVR